MEPDYFSKHTPSGPTVGLTYFTYWTPETVRKNHRSEGFLESCTTINKELLCAYCDQASWLANFSSSLTENSDAERIKEDDTYSSRSYEQGNFILWRYNVDIGLKNEATIPSVLILRAAAAVRLRQQHLSRMRKEKGPRLSIQASTANACRIIPTDLRFYYLKRYKI